MKAKWIISILVSVFVVGYFFASNIMGEVVGNHGEATISNIAIDYTSNQVQFDLSEPVSQVYNQAGECWSAEPFTHWTCLRPNDMELRLKVKR